MRITVLAFGVSHARLLRPLAIIPVGGCLVITKLLPKKNQPAGDTAFQVRIGRAAAWGSSIAA